MLIKKESNLVVKPGEIYNTDDEIEDFEYDPSKNITQDKVRQSEIASSKL